jgi:hypothetical protein
MSSLNTPCRGGLRGFLASGDQAEIASRVGFGLVEAGAPFEDYLDKALGLIGIEADETERMVMAGVWSLYEPGMELLRDADLDESEPEPRADLSAPPPR